MRRAAIAAALLAASATPAAGQGTASIPAAALAGRWALTLEGGAPPRVRGELRLRDSAGVLAGTLLLATHDSAPAPLLDTELRDRTIEFRAGAGTAMRFVGRIERGRLEGEAFGGAGEQIQTWTAERIADVVEFYPALPRFRLRQVATVMGDSAVIPGAWIAANEAAGPRPAEAYPAYAAAAAAAGLAPLRPDEIAAEGRAYLMGLARREESLAAMRRTLAQIREGIADPRLRLRFDAVFRARNGAWIADLHDAALDRAGRRLRGASWRGAHPGLVAAGWLGPGDTTSATVAQSLYRLAHLQRTDTTRFRLAMERVRLAPEAAPVVEALLTGYDEAARWHAEAVTFLISAPWIAGGPGRPPRALPALLAEFWGRPVVLPEVETAWFGYAQAVPRYAAPPELVQRLLEPDNWTGAEWLRRNGDRRLLTILQRLGADSFPPVTVVTARGPLRLTTVRRLAAERAGGFLAPEDAVVVDPGFPPLLALGSIVHEWQHLEFERARWAAGGTAVPAVEGPGGTVLLRPSEPIVTEGFAEWSTELVLAPLERRYPFLAVAERLKRARFAVTQPDDPHLAGYLLARTLAAALPAADAAARLVAASVDPTAVLDDRRVAEAWQRHRGAADRRTASAGAGLLVPETRFTIEGGWPDVVETRIHP